MIHETAIVDPSAKIDGSVEIGPWSIIGPNVEIGANTWIANNVVVRCNTKIGQRNKIYQFASIGEDPQDISYHGEETYLEIGDDNSIRECVTINRGTKKEQGLTKIGSHNLIMAYSHIAHDCVLKDHVIMANATNLAGHVILEDHAKTSGAVLIHQFCRMGEHSFVSGGSAVVQDVMPHVLVKGDPASPRGVNVVGLSRDGFTKEQLTTMRQAYRVVFRSGKSLADALEAVKALAEECEPLNAWVEMMENTERGIARPTARDDDE